jgi:hypothetical protein
MNNESPAPIPENGQNSATHAHTLTWSDIVEFGGTGLVFWIWAECIHCKDFKELFLYAAALTVFQAGACHFIYKLLKKRRGAFVFSILLWVVFTFLAWRLVIMNSKPASEPKFTFFLGSNVAHRFTLTNDIFRFKWGENNLVRANIAMPISANSESSLLTISVMCDQEVSDAEAAIFISKALNPEAMGWNAFVPARDFPPPPKPPELDLNSMTGYISPIGHIFGGSGKSMPPIVLKNPNFLVSNSPVVIWARASHAPLSGVSFTLTFKPQGAGQ